MKPKIVHSPSDWHTHEVDPETWYKSLKAELEDIERHPPSVYTPPLFFRRS